MQLSVIGIGVNEGDISLSAFEEIKRSKCVLLRTDKTAAAKTIINAGISYTSLDFLYEKSKNFDTLTKNIVKEVGRLLKDNDVCYLCDGAVTDDGSAQILLKKYKNAKVYEGVSKATAALAAAGLTGGEYTAVSAYSLDTFDSFSLPLAVYDLDSVILASEWKLKLFSLIGEEQEVRLYIDKRMISLPMYEIDTLENYDYSTVLIVDKQPLNKKERFDFSDLVEIVRILRAEGGCPWDREQTKESITRTLIEECYELVDAVKKQDDDKICEETGDVLLQTAFYINFAEEELAFSGSDVLSGICSKLIFRHTHVFGGEKAVSADEALAVWNRNKQKEKQYESSTSYLDDVPKNFPAALRCEKVIKRALYCNYQVGDVNASAEKMIKILDSIVKGFATENDYKNLIFTCINLLKRADKSSEDLIAAATDDFIKEFSEVENAVINDGKNMKNLTLQEVEKYRNGIKKS